MYVGGCIQASRHEGHRTWKKRCDGPQRLKQNEDIQWNKTPGSDGVFVLPRKSGVRCSLNLIFENVRLHPTCKNEEQREMRNSGRWGDVCNDFRSGCVGPGRERRVSATCSSTWRCGVLGGLTAWGRTSFRHVRVSPPVFTEGFQFACFDVREHFAAHSIALLVEGCRSSKGCFASESHTWVVNKTELS